MTNLRITAGKGFHLKFDNGVVLSVQIGGGNYCANYDEPILDLPRQYRLPDSPTAEIAVWGRDGDMINLGPDDEGHEETVKGWVPIDRIVDLIPILRGLPDGVCGNDISIALTEFRKND